MGPSGYAADYLISRGLLPRTLVRKLFNCGGFVAQCVFMMAAAYILNETAIIACLTLGVGLGAFSLSGFAVNHLDLAPNFAPLLMGVTNTFATIPGIISPSLTGLLVTSTDEEEMKSQWRIVFFVAASIYLFGAVFYWIFCSGELQPWAVEQEEETLNHTKSDMELSQKDAAKNSHAYENKGMEKEMST